MSIALDVVAAAEHNENYRSVVHTGDLSQLVVMSIPPGEDVGEESHRHVEQTLTCVSGRGIAVLSGEEYPFEPGDCVVVTPGTRHNIINTDRKPWTPLKLFTVYVPPNHIDGRVHRTKADAEADTDDQDFGPG